MSDLRSTLAQDAIALRTAAQTCQDEIAESWCDCGACSECCETAFRAGQAAAFEAAAALLEGRILRLD